MKRFDFRDGKSRNAGSLVGKPFSSLAIVFADDGELGVFGVNDFAGAAGETPNELVEVGTHTGESIANGQTDRVGNVEKYNFKDMLLMFKIIATAAGIGMSFASPDEFLNQRIQSVEVAFRPVEL